MHFRATTKANEDLTIFFPAIVETLEDGSYIWYLSHCVPYTDEDKAYEHAAHMLEAGRNELLRCISKNFDHD